MSPLERHLHHSIQKNGPLKLSAFMEQCLLHPLYGYYKKSSPLGKDGDFITSPEISQLFGEMIGLFFIDLWQKWKEPASCSFIEFGPGNGTLITDIVRIFKKFPRLYEGCTFFFLETNAPLQQRQKELFSKISLPYYSFENLSDLLNALPTAPIFFLGNEFLDVFPIDQYIFSPPHWFEKCVDFDTLSQKFYFKNIPLPHHPFDENFSRVSSLLENLSSPFVFEISPLQERFLFTLFQFLQNKCFSGIFIDYGHDSGTGDSFQSFSKHKVSNPLEDLGKQDLTAHVNFQRLQLLVALRHPTFKIKGPVSQRDFLKNLGIDIRARILIESNPQAQTKILGELFRLTDPTQMGTLFKVLEFHHP